MKNLDITQTAYDYCYWQMQKEAYDVMYMEAVKNITTRDFLRDSWNLILDQVDE
jgi:hypothetical protein